MEDWLDNAPGQAHPLRALRHRMLHYQTALVELGTHAEEDLEQFIQKVLRSDSELLDVARVSFWTFGGDARTLDCAQLYDATSGSFDGGHSITREDNPSYFDATRTSRIIAAHDVGQDPRTRDFLKSYLEPLGIRSLLDVPVWRDGTLAGVLCHEHVGEPRRWRAVEQAFAVSMGQFVSLGLERAERHRTERALEDTQHTIAMISASSPHLSLMMLDPEGRIVAGRHGSQRWLEALAGSPHSVLYPPQDVARGRPVAALEIAARRGHHEEQGWLLRPDGTRFWAHVSVRALRHPRGDLRGFAIVTHDLTAQRLARQNERLLRTASRVARQQQLLAQTSAAISSSFDVRRILQRAAKALCGSFADACALQLQPPAAKHPAERALCARTKGLEGRLSDVAEALSDPAAWGAHMRRTIASGTPAFLRELDEDAIARITDDENVRAVFRSLMPCSLIATPLRVRRRSHGMLVVLRQGTDHAFQPRDVGTVRELAQRIAYAVDSARLYELSREATRQRDDFLSVAAHELRTPLTTLRLQLQLLDRDLARAGLAGPKHPAGRHLATAHRQARRLSALVHELLDLTRVTSGRLELHREETDLTALTSELLETFRDDAARAGAELIADVEPEVRGQWDPGRLEQVLTNLISNAIKYGRGQPVRVTVRATADDAFISVADRGLGIAEEDAERIFGRFERAVSSRHFGGLGLGLFIVRRIVDAHGGEIRVSSTPGRGAVFTVRLPRVPGVSPDRSATAEPEHALH